MIADGFPETTDPNALIIGPTGVGLDAFDVLYVADTLGNRIAAIPNALTRTSILGDGGLPYPQETTSTAHSGSRSHRTATS